MTIKRRRGTSLQRCFAESEETDNSNEYRHQCLKSTGGSWVKKLQSSAKKEDNEENDQESFQTHLLRYLGRRRSCGAPAIMLYVRHARIHSMKYVAAPQSPLLL
jgi:hypothetical protein